MDARTSKKMLHIKRNIRTKQNANIVGVGALDDPHFEGNATDSPKTYSNPNSQIRTLTYNHKGITLIALIITIIVMLILVGVTVSIAINGGLFSAAKDAASRTQIAKEKEQIMAGYSAYQMVRMQGEEANLEVAGATVTGNETDGWIITFEETGNTYKLYPDGRIEKIEEEVLEELTDIYVTLYKDGTLGFSNNQDKIVGKDVSEEYGNIKGKTFNYYGNEAPWRADKDNIIIVEIQNEIVPNETALWFYDCNHLTTINGIEKLNTSNVTSMSWMFGCCKNLTELDLTSFNTQNVTDMHSMFERCDKLETLNISNFNTSKVTDMSYLFDYCLSLTQLDLSSFNTDNVTNMSGMFDNCSKLTELDLSNFKTNNVTDMSWMFIDCSSLKGLDLKNFDTTLVTNMSLMFNGCSNLSELDLSNFKTDNVTNMSSMFYSCSSLSELNLGNFKTNNVTDMHWMFDNCRSLKVLDLKNFDTTLVTDMSSMFSGCSGISELDLSNFETSNVTDMDWMFQGCSGLTELDLGSFDTSNVTNMSRMFSGCSGLSELDLSNFDTSKVKDMSSMFSGCTNLKLVYGRKDRWNTDNVTDNGNMWKDCGTNYITYKTYLEGDKLVGYEIAEGLGWSGNPNVSRTGNAQRASSMHVIQLDPEKTYEIKMTNPNYYYGCNIVDLDSELVKENKWKLKKDNGWINPSNTLTITDTKYAVLNFKYQSAGSTKITPEMVDEINQAFEIRVVE